MSTSTLVPVLSYLSGAITTQVADPSVSVHIGTLAQDTPLNIIVVGHEIRQVFKPGRMVGGGGTGWLDENYIIYTDVDVSSGDTDMAALLTRAQTLVEAVWSVVRGDPTLGGLVVEAKPMDADWRPEWRADRRGPRVVVTLGVDVFASV